MTATHSNLLLAVTVSKILILAATAISAEQEVTTANMETNGTPFTDEQWRSWYAHKSNKERWIEEQERSKELNETDI